VNSIVLARYNESLDWIQQIPDDFDVIIYNKGAPIESPEVIRRATQIIERPNVGRESETYLHHMMQVRDDQDFTVYSQGDPHSHSPDFIALLENWRDWNKLQALSWQWLADNNIPPATLLADYQRELGGRLRVRPERFSLTAWGPIDFIDQGASGMGMVYRICQGNLPDGTNIASHLLRMCKLDAQAEKADKHTLGIFSYGAIFAARNDLVAAVPRESLELLSQFSTAGVAAYGYVLERMWLHILGADFILPKNQPSRI